MFEKKKCLMFFCLALTFLSVRAVERLEIINNNDFSQTRTGNTGIMDWSFNPSVWSKSKHGHIKLSRADCRKGAACMEMSCAADEKTGVMSGSVFKVEKDCAVKYSLWIKGRGIVELGIYPYWSGGGNAAVAKRFQINSDKWRKFDYELVLRKKQIKMARIVINLIGPGKVWVDDFSGAVEIP